MTRLYDATFEGNSLTGANGGDSITGSPVVYTTSPIKGTYMMQIPDAAVQFLRFSPAVQDEIFLSTYIKVSAYPTATMRMIFSSNSGTAVCSIYLTTTGTLQLRNSAATILGTSGVLSLNTVYRIGMHYKKGTGANAILEGFLATGDDAFGSAFQSTTNGTETAQVNRIDIGNQAAGSTKEKFFDDIRIDTVSMPGPSSVNTAKAINITITETVTRSNKIGKIITRATTTSITKKIILSKNISRSITTSSLIRKNIVKTLLYTITITISRSIRKLLTLLVTYNVGMVSIMRRNISKIRIVSSSVISSMSKTIQNQLTYASMKTNARSIIISLKNSASRILSNNTRTISYQDVDKS